MTNEHTRIQQLRGLILEKKPTRERSLALTKLDECEMWLARCEPDDGPIKPE